MTKNKDDEIPGMKINFNAIDTATEIPNCMTIQEKQQAVGKDDHLHQLREHFVRG